ncbi:MAG: SEC-C metal-binding domain-containing protein, partial [Acidimicrobiales bacterium]
EQRKVIYARRLQILDGEDLRARTVEVLTSALDSIVSAHCSGGDRDDWDLDGMLTETRLYFPTTLAKDNLEEAQTTDELYEMLAANALEYYARREEEIPGGEDTMRALEREVMIQLIDQKWREHLSEMDYLREGIGLRAMGQQDPLVAWQRDGYEMFGQMMSSIDDDYTRIVMHAQVQVLDQANPDDDSLVGASYQAASEPVQGSGGLQSALAAGPAPGEEIEANGAGGAQAAARAAEPEVQQTVVKSNDFDRAGRNDPCPCGSGKKFKFCHGR